MSSRDTSFSSDVLGDSTMAASVREIRAHWQGIPPLTDDQAIALYESVMGSTDKSCKADGLSVGDQFDERDGHA